jgi:hypothetical protein
MRADYDGRAVSPAHLALLANAALVPGVKLVLLTDRPEGALAGGLTPD